MNVLKSPHRGFTSGLILTDKNEESLDTSAPNIEARLREIENQTQEFRKNIKQQVGLVQSN